MLNISALWDVVPWVMVDADWRFKLSYCLWNQDVHVENLGGNRGQGEWERIVAGLLGGGLEIKVQREKGRSLKGQFLSGANRRTVWLVNPKMPTLVHSTDLFILHMLQAAIFGALCNYDWLYLCTSLLKFKVHSYRNSLFTMVFSVNYHCHCCYDYWISLCLLVSLFPHKFMCPLCSGIVKWNFCVVCSVWGL